MADNTKAPDKPRSRTGIYIGLGAGAVLLFTCCVCGVGGGVGYYYWTPPANKMVGKWELSDNHLGQPRKTELEFTATGTASKKITWKNVSKFEYKTFVVQGPPLVVEMEFTSAMMGDLVIKDLVGSNERWEVTFVGDTMKMKDLKMKSGSFTYRRVP